MTKLDDGQSGVFLIYFGSTALSYVGRITCSFPVGAPFRQYTIRNLAQIAVEPDTSKAGAFHLQFFAPWEPLAADQDIDVTEHQVVLVNPKEAFLNHYIQATSGIVLPNGNGQVAVHQPLVSVK